MNSGPWGYGPITLPLRHSRDLTMIKNVQYKYYRQEISFTLAVLGSRSLVFRITMDALFVAEQTAPSHHAALGPWHPKVQQPKASLAVQNDWALQALVRALAGSCVRTLENAPSLRAWRCEQTHRDTPLGLSKTPIRFLYMF